MNRAAKFCPRCQHVKLIADFGIHKTGKPKCWCKECCSSAEAERRQGPRRHELSRRKEELRRKSVALDDAAGRVTIWRRARLKAIYGMRPEDYQELFENQGGKCAICGRHQDKLRYRLAVDHDHATQKVRGLLCQNCNAGLGNFGDKADAIEKAITYLKKGPALPLHWVRWERGAGRPKRPAPAPEATKGDDPCAPQS